MLITDKANNNSLVKGLQTSFSNQTLCDISLYCEGKVIKCHRAVLSQFSSYFNTMFAQYRAHSSIPLDTLGLVDTKYAHLESLIKFMYFGKIRLGKDEMDPLLKCAEKLGMGALVKFASDYVKENPDQDVSLTNSTNPSTNTNNSESLNGNRKRPRNPDEEKQAPSSEKVKESNERTSTCPEILLSNSNSKNSSALNCNDSSSTTRKRQRNVNDEEKDKLRTEKPKEHQSADHDTSHSNGNKDSTSLSSHTTDAVTISRKKPKNVSDEDKAKENIEKPKENVEKPKEIIILDKPKENIENPQPVAVSIVKCSVCTKEHKDNVFHKKIDPNVGSDKKCNYNGCSKQVKFRRSLIDHLLREHKVDVCDG